MKKIFYFVLLSVLLTGTFAFSQPTPPTNLKAAESHNAMHPAFVKLEWTGSSTPSFYNVYRKEITADSTSYVLRRWGLLQPEFNDYRVLRGITYAYYVTAVNLSGESEPSNEVQITVSGTTNTVDVRGTIKNEKTLAGIPRAFALFFRTTGMEMGFPVVTDSAGTFKINLPPGRYYLKTMARGYRSEFYNNAEHLKDAAIIEVNSGADLNFDILLKPYETPVLYTLSGSVRDSIGNPLRAGIGVFALRDYTHHHAIQFTRTDSLGNYSVQVRSGDTVIVYAYPADQNFFPEFWDDKSSFMDADRIYVKGDVGNIDFLLQGKAVYRNSLSGHVRDIYGRPVESFVSAIKKGPLLTIRRYTVTTDSLGGYNFTDLAPGKYILISFPKEGYFPTYFRYDSTQTLRWREADSVMITESSVLTGYDFNVLPFPEQGEGLISGTISNSTGVGISGAFVYALNSEGETAGYGLTDNQGKYYISGLSQDNYQVFSDRMEYLSPSPINVSIEYEGHPEAQVNMSMKSETPNEVKEKPETVSSYQLYQNYPNPFNPVTRIKYSVPERANVRITVFNLLGVVVAQLVNEIKETGEYSVTFDGSGLSSGVYFYKMEAGDYVTTRKLTLLK